MKHTADPAGTTRAGRREWIGLALLALPALLVSMDLTVLHLAVPSLSADLRPSSAQLLWIVDVYGFLIAGFLITMGSLGDRIGRRRLLLIGAGGFGVASVLAAFSTSPEMLIAARALLGIAGATLAPSTLALIRTVFQDPDQRTVAISAWFASFLAGAALGPLVGGALLQFFWWGAAFLVGVPVMVLLLVLGPSLLPEYRDPHAGRMDLVSAALALAAVLGIVYGLKEIAAGGLSVAPVVVTVLGLLAGVVGIRRQRALESPLVDLGLFRSRAFSVSLGALTLSAVVMGGVGYLVAQYLQLVVGLSPLAAGLWMLIPLGAGIASMTVAPVLVRRVRPGQVVATGLAAAAATSAVALAAMAVVTGVVLRGQAAGPGPEHRADPEPSAGPGPTSTNEPVGQR
jgi:DHA2 family multidrug resistance protein-like MFS transporter